MNRLVCALFLCLAALTAANSQAAAPLTETDYQRIDGNAAAGFTYPYYLYVPPELKAADEKKKVQTILVVPNNTGKNSDDFAVHDADVRKRMSMNGAIASLLKIAILMPVFPRPERDWRIYTHALDRDTMVTDKKEYRRLDLQMVAMIDDARSKLAKDGLTFDKRILINGFSAQGMFANRFTFLHPDRVKGAAIGSPGGWPIAPVAKYREKALRYPIGVADIKAVTGKGLDLKTLRKVPLFVFLGAKDTNDSVPFDDSYDQEDRDLIYPLFGKTPVERWAISETLYKQAGLNAEFKLYPDVPHTVSPLMRDDIRAFLMKHK